MFYLYNSTASIDVTISGLTIAHGAAPIGAGIINYDEILTLDNVTLTGNVAAGDGGALWADGFSMVLTVRNSTITGNTSGADGGGIYVEDTGGPLLIQNSTISNNQATRHGGGIYFYDPDHDITIENSTISGNVAGQKGGGIYLYDTDSGVVTIRNSAITGNSAQNGGGIFLYGPDHPVLIENSTISGNTATQDGGGLMVSDGMSTLLTLSNVTIAENAATRRGGGIFHTGDASVLVNVLAAKNQAGSQANGHDIYRDSGTIDASNSLIQDAPGGTINGSSANNLFNVDPLLGPLQNNGGPTFTHALLDGSPAIDTGAAPGTLSLDQRGTGFVRIVGTSADIGAFEWQPTLSISGAATVVPGQAATLTITLSAAPTAPYTIVVTPSATGTSPAVAGTHFDATPITVVVPTGSTSATITIPTYAATPSDVDLTFTVSLANGAGGAITSVSPITIRLSATHSSNIAPVPTLSQWALALLAGLLGFTARRGRKR